MNDQSRPLTTGGTPHGTSNSPRVTRESHTRSSLITSAMASATAATMLSHAWSAVTFPCRHAVSSTFIMSLQRGYHGWETVGTTSAKFVAPFQADRIVGTSPHFDQPLRNSSLSMTDW